jgi:hypothetical protein
MGRIRCENLVKLTGAKLTAKMRLEEQKHTLMGENHRTCGNLAWSDPKHLITLAMTRTSQF